MNHDILKTVIYDQREAIKESLIVKRGVSFEEKGNYVLVGPRRAGKSTILKQRVLDLLASGVSFDQIVFINFEDDRLLEFTYHDFEDIVTVGEELAKGKTPYYFLDELQIIEGWESFAFRVAETGRRVYITGSNAKMLSREIEAKLGGRYLTKNVYPYSFDEYCKASKVNLDDLSSKNKARVNALLKDYFTYGAFPGTLDFVEKKEYALNVYEKILLGDIIARNKIRKANELRVLIKKIGETVHNEVSYTRLYDTMKSIGFAMTKDSVIDYCHYAEEAMLLFHTEDYYASFVEKESNPRFYFIDNGILNLILINKDPALLENLIAITLKRRYGGLYYVRSVKSKIDVDFFMPEEGLAVQACYSLKDASTLEREVKNLIKLAKSEPLVKKALIVTYEERLSFEQEGIKIEAIPLSTFLLGRY